MVLRKEAPDSYVIVNSASQSEEKFDYWGIQKWISQKRESFFFQEFNDFIAQHKVLYSPAMNVLILSYDPEVKRFNIVSKDGFLAGVGFGDLPVFMERYPNAVEVRTSRNETIQSIGLGTTFSGQSFHLSRGQNYYGDLLYYIEE